MRTLSIAKPHPSLRLSHGKSPLRIPRTMVEDLLPEPATTPDYFYDGLGDGASRVEHVSADFLGDAKELGEQLKKIDHV